MVSQHTMARVEPFANPDGHRCGTYLPVPARGDPVKEGLCVDGSECGHEAHYVVSRGEVSVLACGRHREAAKDLVGHESARSGVGLREGAAKDPMDREPDDYDVSDHPAFEGNL